MGPKGNFIYLSKAVCRNNYNLKIPNFLRNLDGEQHLAGLRGNSNPEAKD